MILNQERQARINAVSMLIDIMQTHCTQIAEFKNMDYIVYPLLCGLKAEIKATWKFSHPRLGYSIQGAMVKVLFDKRRDIIKKISSQLKRKKS